MKIAEGCGRDVIMDYVGCLQQARGMGNSFSRMTFSSSNGQPMKAYNIK